MFRIGKSSLDKLCRHLFICRDCVTKIVICFLACLSVLRLDAFASTAYLKQ